MDFVHKPPGSSLIGRVVALGVTGIGSSPNFLNRSATLRVFVGFSPVFMCVVVSVIFVGESPKELTVLGRIPNTVIRLLLCFEERVTTLSSCSVVFRCVLFHERGFTLLNA